VQGKKTFQVEGNTYAKTRINIKEHGILGVQKGLLSSYTPDARRGMSDYCK
jgi:hypothetical protein